MTADAACAPRLEEIADGVHAYVQPDGGWCLNNAGLVTGRHRSVLVDTAATEARARRLRQVIHRIVGRDPDYVVNTHFHGDHTFGNGLFGPSAVIVSHEATRDDAARAGLSMRDLWPAVTWGQTPLVLPELTFTDTLTLHTGDLEVRLLSVGPAHTAADTVVWVPDRLVLFTGDVVWNKVTPFILFGSLSGSLDAVRRLRRLGARTIVPGHGPVGGPELLDDTEAYLRWIHELATEGLRDGVPPLEAARRAGPHRFRRLVDPERLAANLHRAYAELGGRRFELPEIQQAFEDMVEYLGRHPESHA